MMLPEGCDKLYVPLAFADVGAAAGAAAEAWAGAGAAGAVSITGAVPAAANSGYAALPLPSLLVTPPLATSRFEVPALGTGAVDEDGDGRGAVAVVSGRSSTDFRSKLKLERGHCRFDDDVAVAVPGISGSRGSGIREPPVALATLLSADEDAAVACTASGSNVSCTCTSTAAASARERWAKFSSACTACLEVCNQV
jgi:hypothetical protein